MGRLLNGKTLLLLGVMAGIVVAFKEKWLGGVPGVSQNIVAAPPDWEPRMRMADVSPDKDLGLSVEALTGRRAYNLLKDGRYDELNVLLNGLQAEVDADIKKEAKIVDAFSGFEVADPAAKGLFDAWVDKYPGEWAPRGARGIYFVYLGWESRGGKWAKDTSDKQFGGMEWYFDMARKDLEAALRQNPRFIPGLNALVGVAGNTGRSGGAIKAAVAAAPNSFLLRFQCLHFLKPRWGGSYEAMDEFARESQAYADENPKMKYLSGVALADQADLARRDKDYVAALALIQRALDGAPDYWKYYYERGRIKYFAERPAEAVEDFDRAAALRTAPEIFAGRALALVDLDRLEEATTDLEKAMQIAPFSDDGYDARIFGTKRLIKRGHEQYKNGDYARAEPLFRWALRLSPGSADAHSRLAYLYSKQERFAEAEAEVRAAISREPKYFDYYRQLDSTLARRGDWDGIIGAWTDYLRLDPASGPAYMERGGAKHRKGDLAGAKADAQRACDLGVAEACALVR